MFFLRIRGSTEARGSNSKSVKESSKSELENKKSLQQDVRNNNGQSDDKADSCKLKSEEGGSFSGKKCYIKFIVYF